MGIKEEINAFMNKVKQDEDLQLFIRQSLEKEKNDMEQFFVTLAHENGYSFTVEQFKQFIQDGLSASESSLDDTQLEAVSGGKATVDQWVWLSVIIIGCVASVIAEIHPDMDNC